MYWEEKIDWLKKEYAPADFHVPYTDGQSILRKIEACFIERNNSATISWSKNIKHKHLLDKVSLAQFDQFLNKLDVGTNYWIVVFDDRLTVKQMIYDGKPAVISQLASMAGGSFFIVDKKYTWLTWFHLDRDKQELTVYKSGDKITPFEN